MLSKEIISYLKDLLYDDAAKEEVIVALMQAQYTNFSKEACLDRYRARSSKAAWNRKYKAIINALIRHEAIHEVA